MKLMIVPSFVAILLILIFFLVFTLQKNPVLLIPNMIVLMLLLIGIHIVFVIAYGSMIRKLKQISTLVAAITLTRKQ